MTRPIASLLFIFLLFTLIGCALTIPQQPNATTPQTFLPTTTSTLTQELVPTFAANFEIQSRCSQINLDVSAIPALRGTIVLSGEDILIDDKYYSPNPDQKSILLFWETQSGKKTSYQLPEHQEYYYYVTSPDKEKLAFTEGKTLSMQSDVIVLNQYGEENGRFTLPDDWTLFDWLNNETMLARQVRLRGDNTDLIALNPVDGKQQVLPSNFPNLYSKETLVFWGALTLFDPTASLVLYPKREENEVISVLWDVHNNKEIASIVGGKWPRWSPDGDRLLIAVDYESKLHESHAEIVLINAQGNTVRSTFFKDYFEINQIDLPAWSRNGRYIAFWLSTALPVKTARLAVLDTETSTVDLFCNEMAPFPFRFGDSSTLGYSYNQVNSAPPIWSPDSNYLLVEDYEQFKSNTYLFDLQSHTITKIADNARPVSWMK